MFKRFFARVASFINRHKTKAAGLAVVLLAYVQANPQLIQAAFSPATVARATLAVGLLVTVFGFINTALQNKQ